MSDERKIIIDPSEDSPRQEAKAAQEASAAGDSQASSQSQGCAKEAGSGFVAGDSDWKEQARKEKEHLKEKAGGQSPGSAGAVPPATITTLVNQLMLQAMFFLGKVPDGSGQEPAVNFDMARYQIDLLQMLNEKTQGNLTDEEQAALTTALHELRMVYLQMAS